MKLFKAMYAFWQTLRVHDCEHVRVTTTPGQPATSAFCPDCGYRVLMRWTLCRCRTCGSKRHPKIQLDGRISPMYRYCQHCGQTDYQIIKRDKINVHEMPYAILTKDVDYGDERVNPSPRAASNPFELPPLRQRSSVVDGEVLGKREFVRPLHSS